MHFHHLASNGQLSRSSESVEELIISLTIPQHNKMKRDSKKKPEKVKRKEKPNAYEINSGERTVEEGADTGPIYGPRKTGPINGNCRENPKTTGKKSPNKLIIPNTSTQIPTIGHFKNIKTTPPRKHIVPRNLCFLAKK